jgi:glutamate 5-kinase
MATTWEHKVEFISLMQTAALSSQAKMSDAAFDRVQAKCTELGAQGWELVTVSSLATTAGATATHVIAGFKRPKG